MEEFITCFSAVSDPRQENIRHRLDDVLLIALCTMLCGGEDCSGREAFDRAEAPTRRDGRHFHTRKLSRETGRDHRKVALPSHETAANRHLLAPKA